MTDQNRLRPSSRPVRVAGLFLLLLGFAVVGFGIGQWRANLADRDLRRALLQQAVSLAQAIPAGSVETLSFSDSDRQNPQFGRLSRWLGHYRSEIGCRGIWSVARRNGRLVFGPESYTQNDPRASPPGTVYQQPPDRILDVFETGNPAVFGPYTDEFGTFVSAVAPVISTHSARVLAVIGIDLEASGWKAAMERKRRLAVLGVSPLMLVGLGLFGLVCRRQGRSDSRSLWVTYAEAVWVAVAGLAMTAAAAWVAHDSENRFRREAFGLLARAEAKPVFETFVALDRNLQTLSRFFDSSEFVDRSEFELFTRPLIRWSGIQDFAWIRSVPDAAKHQAEAQARAEGVENFAFWQFDAGGQKGAASRRLVYYPVWYIEPIQFNRSYLGYDLGAEPCQRGILEASADSGMPAAIEIPGPEGQQTLLLAVQAVFADRQPSDCLGFVAARVRLDEFMTAVQRSGDPSGSVAVVGLQRIEAGQGRRFLASSSADHSALHRARRPDDPPIHPESEALAAVFPLFVFDHAYVLTVYPQPSFMAAYPEQAGILTSVVGTLFTLLLTAFTGTILRGRVGLEAKVRARTAELELKSLVLDQIQDHIAIIDLQGVITYVNQAELDTLARSREELIGQPMDILGEDREQGATQKKILESTLRQGTWRGEVVNITGDGRGRIFDCRTQVIKDADGQTMALCGISTDITERKRAETILRELKELHESIVQTMNEGIVLTDTDGRVTFINPELAALLGWTPEELVGRSWFEFVPPEYHAAARAADARRADGQKDRYEIELQRRDGTRIPILMSGTPRLDPVNSQFAGTLGVITDLSEQKRAEQERQRLQDQLYQAQKMESVGRLAGGVAHDYNNMLSVIIGYAEMALDRVDGKDPLRTDLLEILKAARHSADITRQLLGFARKQPISPRILDLNETVEGMLKMLRRLIGEDIDLSWRPSAGLWPVKMDPTQIDQLLANLCVNARDAITGVGQIIISSGNAHLDAIKGPDAASFKPGDFALLTVADNGSGMDAETLERLFEPFFTTKPFGQGTGLGLATVYGIVKQNNGYIEASSAPDQGATFRIYFPRQHQEAEASQASAVISNDLPRGRGETILIIEDETPILHVVQQMLQRLGYLVLPADSPGQALELAGANAGRIALVMIDVVMPGMNGRELAKRLKETSPDLRTLFMSGYTADVIARRGVLESDTPFLQKPFTLHDLAVRVKQALESP